MHPGPITRFRFRVSMLFAAVLYTLHTSLPRQLAQAWSMPPMAGGEETEDEKKEREERERKERERKERKEREEEEDDDEETPPWGSDEDFKPEKAWKLIKNLRADNGKLKSQRDDLQKKVDEHEEENKTEAEKREARAKKAEDDAKEKGLEAARLRVALKKGLTETQAKRLVGDDEDALEKDADELLADFKGEEGEGEDGEEEQGSRGGRRPTERKARPGAAPAAKPDESDPAKLAEAVPRGY